MDVVMLVFIYFFIFFILGTAVKNNSIVDIGWGIGFVVIAMYMFFKNLSSLMLPQIIITILVGIWGVRLFYHIIKRNFGKPEDFRYANWRKKWGKFVVVRSFFQVYMLQGLFMLLISLPVILVSNTLNIYLLLFGVIIWIVGFVFEALGDFQLKMFLKEKNNKGKIMQSGLWKYTRHPNYFGEATMWWGIYIIAISSGSSILAIISPITITFLLVFVSGVPLLEKSMKSIEGYDEYAKKTSIFVPWFNKK